MLVKFSKQFIKQYDKAPANIKSTVDKTLKLFIQNSSIPKLNNHALAGKLSGYRSINITGDWRAIFKESEEEKTVIFVALGTHSQLYR